MVVPTLSAQLRLVHLHCWLRCSACYIGGVLKGAHAHTYQLNWVLFLHQLCSGIALYSNQPKVIQCTVVIVSKLGKKCWIIDLHTCLNVYRISSNRMCALYLFQCFDIACIIQGCFVFEGALYFLSMKPHPEISLN